MTNVLVLAGGTSAEREVSLRSGKAVAVALETAGFEVTQRDLGANLDEHLAAMQAADVVFPALHGAGGEDGTIQAYLEAHDICYVGSDAAASRLCFDKWQYKQLMRAHDLPVSKGVLVQRDAYPTHELAQGPHVLKALTGGSSIDTYIIRDPANIPKEQIAETFQRYPTMLLEKLIEGVELTVGILGDEPLPVIEIVPPSDGEFDYENKYNGKTQELTPPRHVGDDIQHAAQQLALQAHRLAGCRDFSRTDIMVDKAGTLFLLETNTIPGMTDQSLFPKMARADGIEMPELCKQLVEMTLKH